MRVNILAVGEAEKNAEERRWEQLVNCGDPKGDSG